MIVVVVPVVNGKFLMVFNPRRGWEFPGGKVEPGENPEQAAVRECLEESGIVLKTLNFLEKDENMVVFWGEVDEVRGGEMQWAIFEKLPEQLAFPREEAERFLNKLHIYT